VILIVEVAMGWVSFLEDIQARLAEDLARSSRQIDKYEQHSRKNAANSGTYGQGFVLLKSIHRQCESMLMEITSVLEIATDPSIDIAHELEVLRREQEFAAKTITSLRSELALELEHRKELEDRFKRQDTALKKLAGELLKTQQALRRREAGPARLEEIKRKQKKLEASRQKK
jgi:hypothetical protein